MSNRIPFRLSIAQRTNFINIYIYIYIYNPAIHNLISGNEFLSRILAQGLYELKVELEDFNSETRYAKYTTFNVGDRTSNFKLTVGDYSGDAGI